jgi:hypothetical protein
MHLDLTTIRSNFSDLKHLAILFDNPGGAKGTQPVLDHMNIYPDRAHLASIIGKADVLALLRSNPAIAILTFERRGHERR